VHRLAAIAVDVGGEHLGAGARELLGVDLADALAAAGDDGDAVLQIEARIGGHGVLCAGPISLSRSSGACLWHARAANSLSLPLWGGSLASQTSLRSLRKLDCAGIRARAGWGPGVQCTPTIPHPASLGYRLRSASLPTRGRDEARMSRAQCPSSAPNCLRACFIVRGFVSAPGRRLLFPSPDKSPRDGAPSGAFKVHALRRGRLASRPGARLSALHWRHFSIPGRAFRGGFAAPISQLLAGGP